MTHVPVPTTVPPVDFAIENSWYSKFGIVDFARHILLIHIAAGSDCYLQQDKIVVLAKSQ